MLTAALSYEHYSDTLVAATFGRGIYKLAGAKGALLRTKAHMDGAATVPGVCGIQQAEAAAAAVVRMQVGESERATGG